MQQTVLSLSRLVELWRKIPAADDHPAGGPSSAFFRDDYSNGVQYNECATDFSAGSMSAVSSFEHSRQQWQAPLRGSTAFQLSPPVASQPSNSQAASLHLGQVPEKLWASELCGPAMTDGPGSHRPRHSRSFSENLFEQVQCPPGQPSVARHAASSSRGPPPDTFARGSYDEMWRKAVGARDMADQQEGAQGLVTCQSGVGFDLDPLSRLLREEHCSMSEDRAGCQDGRMALGQLLGDLDRARFQPQPRAENSINGHARQFDSASVAPESFEIMPRDVPSIGSAGHDLLDCKPCLFWYEGSCNKGRQCLFCHIPHDLDAVRRVRPSKQTRARLQWHRKLMDGPPA